MNKFEMTFAAVGMLLLIAGCTQPTNTKTVPSEPVAYEKDWMLDGYASVHGIDRKQAETFFQQTYGMKSEKDIGQKLPERTENFEKDKQKMQGGSTAELGTIQTENYLQPDFYETFETTGKKTWVNAPEGYPSAVGLFSIPADQEATLEKDSETFETYLFVGSSWGVTYCQGMELFATIEPKAPIVFEIDQPSMVVGPTFPIFEKEWMKRIHVTGRITGKMAPGKYVITINAALPSNDKQEEWSQTYERYANIDTIFVDPRGLATLMLNVPE